MRSGSPHDRKTRGVCSSAEEEDLEDYEPFDAFDSGEVSDNEDDKFESVIYSDFNSFRDGEDEHDLPSGDENYSFDSFDTGQTLASEDGEKAMTFLLESEEKSEVSLAPALFAIHKKRYIQC